SGWRSTTGCYASRRRWVPTRRSRGGLFSGAGRAERKHRCLRFARPAPLTESSHANNSTSSFKRFAPRRVVRSLIVLRSLMLTPAVASAAAPWPFGLRPRFLPVEPPPLLRIVLLYDEIMLGWMSR